MILSSMSKGDIPQSQLVARAELVIARCVKKKYRMAYFITSTSRLLLQTHRETSIAVLRSGRGSGSQKKASHEDSRDTVHFGG